MSDDTNPTNDPNAEPAATGPVDATGSTGEATTPRRQFQVTRPGAAPAPSDAVDQRYAVIATGGKQYRVKVGDRIHVERLQGDAGAAISIDQVLLVGGDGATRIGTPVVQGASVEATIDAQDRGDKIVVFKYKPKKRYRRRIGHRQERTRLTITGINA